MNLFTKTCKDIGYIYFKIKQRKTVPVKPNPQTISACRALTI